MNRSFWPDLEATGQFLTELCEDLSAENEITFIAGPSYHAGQSPRGPWRRERMGTVEIIRTWGTRLPKRRLALRIINLGTYFALAAAAALRLKPPEVVIAETDPPLLGALGAILKRRWGCRLIYNVRDLYPDIAQATGGVKNSLLLRILERGNRMAYESADRVIVLGEDMAGRVIAKGVAPERVTIVPDWVDCQRIRPLESNPFRTEFGDRFVVMYSGNLGLSQQLDMVLDAADRLRDDKRIIFVLIGAGARRDWLVERARKLGLPNVMFLPYRPKEKLAESLSAADLHLIPLSAGTAGCLVPSKIYGILAAGRPFVAIMEEFAEVARIARDHAVGFVSPPGDAEAMVRIVRAAVSAPAELKMMGKRARRLAEAKFDRAIVTRRFGEVLAETVETNDYAAGK
ncbi:MAG: glycosyltransferase family 4 protein [Candidatus Binataceae bacterium]